MEKVFQPKSEKPKFIYENGPSKELLKQEYIDELYKIPVALYDDNGQKGNLLKNYSEKFDSSGVNDSLREAIGQIDGLVGQINDIFKSSKPENQVEERVMEKTEEVLELLYLGMDDKVIQRRISNFKVMCKEYKEKKLIDNNTTEQLNNIAI